MFLLTISGVEDSTAILCRAVHVKMRFWMKMSCGACSVACKNEVLDENCKEMTTKKETEDLRLNICFVPPYTSWN